MQGLKAVLVTQEPQPFSEVHEHRLEAFMGSKQFAALPFRGDETDLEVLLITTRRKRRWSLPKGSRIGSKKPHRTAELEAYEEAGLTGAIRKQALGSFKHRKQKGKRKQILDVAVFPMKVSRQQSWWPEKGRREMIWLSPDDAARLVHKAELSRLIVRFAARTARKKRASGR
jgi:8-oxo-dGTP pyrophosphatase MutT (NUDIX family)